MICSKCEENLLREEIPEGNPDKGGDNHGMGICSGSGGNDTDSDASYWFCVVSERSWSGTCIEGEKSRKEGEG